MRLVSIFHTLPEGNLCPPSKLLFHYQEITKGWWQRTASGPCNCSGPSWAPGHDFWCTLSSRPIHPEASSLLWWHTANECLMDNRHVFLKLQDQATGRLGCGEDLLPRPQMASSHCILTWRKGEGVFLVSIIKTLIPSQRTLQPAKGPVPSTVTLVVKLSHTDLGGLKHWAHRQQLP
jgi:hypothetical protein